MGDLYARSVMKREVIMQKLRRSGIKPADTVQRRRGSIDVQRASACVHSSSVRQRGRSSVASGLSSDSHSRHSHGLISRPRQHRPFDGEATAKAMTLVRSSASEQGSLNMVVSQGGKMGDAEIHSCNGIAETTNRDWDQLTL